MRDEMVRHCPNDDCSFLQDIGSRSTFEDHVTHCKDCGAELVTHEPPPAPPRTAPVAPPELVTVAWFNDALEAQAAQSAIEAAGIPTLLTSGCAAGQRTARAAGVCALEIKTSAEHEDAVRRILAEGFEPATEEDLEALAGAALCPHCGGGEFEDRETPVKGVLISVLTLFRLAPPPRTREERYCARCGEKLDD